QLSKDKEQPCSHGHPALAIMENGQVRSNNQGAWKYILSGYSLLMIRSACMKRITALKIKQNESG
ncbi:TPA: hypothetical protein ACGDVI_003947, partial [Acinetobacter baumannii]